MIRRWKQYRAYVKARRDHPAGKALVTEVEGFGPTRIGTDADTRAAVDLPAAVAQAAADAYRQGVEDTEQSMLYSIAYLPDNVDARDFVNKLIENRRRRGDRPGPDMGRWDRRL